MHFKEYVIYNPILIIFSIFIFLFLHSCKLSLSIRRNNEPISHTNKIYSYLLLNFNPSLDMSKIFKKQRLNSQSSDYFSDNINISTVEENEHDSIPLNVPEKKITTLEELENYKTLEERTNLVIHKDKIPLFAKNNLFRNTAKCNLNSRYYYKNDDSDLRTYLLKKWDLIPPELQELIKTESVEYSKVFDTLTYKDLTLEQAFSLVIDDYRGTMVGFETIGHIAHLNIPEERSSIKMLIAKIIFDKHKNIKTVINKRSELSNQFRTMDLELLAGEENYVASLVENGFKFEVDFANVYWNSRLIHERNRISGLLSCNDIVVDMFAGVGPFAIYASKKGCKVLANDLNPVGAEYMEKNVKLNKVGDMVKIYNMDARDFVKNVVKKSNILDKNTLKFEGMELSDNGSVHFIMNLPKIAIEFLDTLFGLADNLKVESLRKCIIHCYCFSGEEGYEDEIDKRISDAIGEKLQNYTITKVRNVSPNKSMYCIEFECPVSILMKRKLDDNEET